MMSLLLLMIHSLRLILAGVLVVVHGYDISWGGGRKISRRTAGLTIATSISSSLVVLTPDHVKATAAVMVSADHETQDLPANTVAPFHVVTDPATYSSLAYAPPSARSSSTPPPPLILFLHGAGTNQRDIRNLVDITSSGEYAGLLPSLVSNHEAPKSLLDNFCILAPYSYLKPTFYSNEARSKLLHFLEWAKSDAGRAAGCPVFDVSRVYLFGFSDGATVGLELMTTRKFQAGVLAAYGFTGTLPDLALQRLQGLPMWIWHSADDVIFPVECSDNLVKALRHVNQENHSNNNRELIRYTRFDSDPEGFTGSVRGHSTGITASKSTQVYEWLASL